MGWRDRKAYASRLAHAPGRGSNLTIRGGGRSKLQDVEDWLDRQALGYIEAAART